MHVLLLPAIGAFAIPYQHVKVAVEQKDHIFLELVDVQLHGDWGVVVSAVAYEGWLNHNHAVGDGLSHQAGFDVHGLVGRVPEGVDERGSPQVINELREMLHRVWQSEAIFVVTRKVGKPHCEFEQYTVHPFLNLYHVLDLRFFGRHSP